MARSGVPVALQIVYSGESKFLSVRREFVVSPDAMRRRAIGQILLLTAGFLVLVAVSTASVILVNKSREDNAWVVHTVEVENQTNALLLEIRRASHVEPDDDGRWFADLSPVEGPKLGPFALRSQALDAERVWLEANCLEAGCRGPGSQAGN